MCAKIVSRKTECSVVAAAAHRSGSALLDDASGITHDYRSKPGVEHAEILAPRHAPEWVYDRYQLWNAAQRCERRKDAQLAREIEIALPLELNAVEHLELVREYAKSASVAHGMVADFAINRENPRNPHAHILLTTRTLKADGFGLKEAVWSDVVFYAGAGICTLVIYPFRAASGI